MLGSQICEIQATITKVGRKLAFAEAVIKDKSTGKVAASFNDVKMIPQMPASSPSGTANARPIGTPETSASPEAAQAFVEGLVNAANCDFDPHASSIFETTALYGLKDISASSGQITCTLPIQSRVENIYGTLHGGCIGKLCHAWQPCINCFSVPATLHKQGLSGP